MCLCDFRVFSKWDLVVIQSADESNAKPNAKLKANSFRTFFYGILLLYQERAARPRHVHQTVVSPIFSSFYFVRYQSPSGLRAAAQQQRLGEICQYNFSFIGSC
jgi:hypothetical protein